MVEFLAWISSNVSLITPFVNHPQYIPLHFHCVTLQRSMLHPTNHLLSVSLFFCTLFCLPHMEHAIRIFVYLFLVFVAMLILTKMFSTCKKFMRHPIKNLYFQLSFNLLLLILANEILIEAPKKLEYCTVFGATEIVRERCHV